MKRGRIASLNIDVEIRPKKKMSKLDSLKPISNYLESLLVSHGLTQHRADLVVLDIAERFVTAGFGWDKGIKVSLLIHSGTSACCFLGGRYFHKEVDSTCVHVQG